MKVKNMHWKNALQKFKISYFVRKMPIDSANAIMGCTQLGGGINSLSKKPVKKPVKKPTKPVKTVKKPTKPVKRLISKP